MTNDQDMSRRRMLRIGGLGSLGLTLPGLLRAEAERSDSAGTSRDGTDPLVHPGVLLRRSQPHRHGRHEAEGPGGGARAVRLDRDERAGDAGLRALAAHRAGDGPPGDRPEHAPPDDQPQCGGVHDAVRPQPAEGRPRAAGQRPQRPAVLRRGPERDVAGAPGPADVGRVAARDVQRGAAPRPGRGLPRLGARPVPGQRRSQRARLPPGRAGAARRHLDRPAG